MGWYCFYNRQIQFVDASFFTHRYQDSLSTTFKLKSSSQNPKSQNAKIVYHFQTKIVLPKSKIQKHNMCRIPVVKYPRIRYKCHLPISNSPIPSVSRPAALFHPPPRFQWKVYFPITHKFATNRTVYLTAESEQFEMVVKRHLEHKYKHKPTIQYRNLSTESKLKWRRRRRGCRFFSSLRSLLHRLSKPPRLRPIILSCECETGICECIWRIRKKRSNRKCCVRKTCSKIRPMQSINRCWANIMMRGESIMGCQRKTANW